MAVDMANADSTTTKDDSITRVRPSDSIMKLNSIDKNNLNKKRPDEYKYKLYAFIIISFIQIFVNYDNGVVPVILDYIQEPYNFKSTELGIMGSLPHLGYFFLSPLLSHILSSYSNKTSLLISIFFNIVSLSLFGLSINKYMFFFSKFFIGVTQALYFTYYPLWVDTFAPENHRNLWMSIVQGGIVVGMTIGYVVTSLFIHCGRFGWRYSILTQIICELILIVMFLFLPPEYVNFDPNRDDVINFDLCTCEKSEKGSGREKSSAKLPVISESDDDDSKANLLSSRKNSINPMTKNDSKSIDDMKRHSAESLNKESGALSATKDGNASDKISYFNQIAASNVEFNLKRCQSLNLIDSRDSLGHSNEIARIYSNFEHSMLKPVEYSKCSKCFLNNVRLYNDVQQIKKLSAWSKFMMLLKHKIFILSCLAISALYFEVTGIHYWMTKMAVSHLKVKEKVFHIIFVIEMVTGPVLGIVTGSHLIDQLIYHHPQKPLLVDLTLIIWGLVTCISSTILLLKQNPMTFIVCVFVIIFIGSAIVPTVTLVSVTYIPHRLKPVGASFFMCQYHILGFTLGTIVPGAAVDVFKSYTAGLLVIFVSGYIGLVIYFLIYFIKWRTIRKDKAIAEQLYNH